MSHHRARLLLGATVVACAFGLFSAGTASANCNVMPDDPMCNPPTTQATTPHTSPPATQHSSSGVQSTQPPVNRSPATNPPKHTTGTAANTYHPPVNNVDQPVVDQPIADVPVVVAPAPAIAVAGNAPVLGGGVASLSPKPASTSSSSGAGTVLWVFGIGLGVAGIAIGARALLGGAGGAPPQPLQQA